MKPSEILTAAADLIEPEGAWTQGWFARSAEGDACVPGDSRATCWCAVGAINAVYPVWNYERQHACDYLATVISFSIEVGSIGAWNDAPERTQAEVVAALREAAELAQMDEP